MTALGIKGKSGKDLTEKHEIMKYKKEDKPLLSCFPDFMSSC